MRANTARPATEGEQWCVTAAGDWEFAETSFFCCTMCRLGEWITWVRTRTEKTTARGPEAEFSWERKKELGSNCAEANQVIMTLAGRGTGPRDVGVAERSQRWRSLHP